jgi:quinol monooxygenase YgiN
MYIVHVDVHVKEDCVAPFIEATKDNASHSLEEPGVLRFDVVQQTDDPTRFVLVEVYKDESAAAAHKETAHYLRWRDTVAPMMAEPRASTKYRAVFPPEEGWRSAR